MDYKGTVLIKHCTFIIYKHCLRHSPENPSVEEEDFSILVKKLRRYINENRQSHETEPNTCPKGGRYIIVVVRASINCSSNEKKIANNQLHGVQDADAAQLYKK